MKKLSFIIAAMFMMLLTACNSCGNKPEAAEEDNAVVIKTNNFEAILSIANVAVMKQYPEFAFYEMSGKIIKEEGKYAIDHSTIQIAYGNPHRNQSVIGIIQNDTLKLQKVDMPWLEDWYMSPVVPLTMDEAIELIQGKIDLEVDGLPIVLRHQLYPNVLSPQWIIGLASSCHSVNVFNGKVDEPLHAGEYEGKIVGAEPGLKK